MTKKSAKPKQEKARITEAQPPMRTKIALIGSAPSSGHLAPYQDQSWNIWACSPGAVPAVKRADVWFEIHYFDPGNPGGNGWGVDHAVFFQQIQRMDIPVYVQQPLPGVEKCLLYPIGEMVAKYGRYFFTSTIAYMFALALEQPGIEEIGLWGIDMSATEEYGYQRAGCHHFVEIARARGVKVTTPKESDLLRPPVLYGFEQGDPMAIKMVAWKADLERQRREAQAAFEESTRKLMYMQGAMDACAYVANTWVSKV